MGGSAHRFDAPRPAAQRRRERDVERVDPQKEYDAFKAF
jgi:GTP-binding protein